MGDMPWNRNEGRYDLPSSGVPGQRLRGDPPAPVAAPPPQPLRRRGKAKP